MSRDLPIRRPGPQVRRQPIRRASPRARPPQVYGLALMIIFTFTTLALMATPVMAARRIEVYGARFTGEALVRQIAGIDSAPNLFGLRTDGIAERLVGLPAVVSARVEVRLPDSIVVTVVERQPRIVWVVGERRYAADETGLLFGTVDEAGNPLPPAWSDLPSPSPSTSAYKEAEQADKETEQADEPEPSETPEATVSAPAILGLATPMAMVARPSIEPVLTPAAVPPAGAGAVKLPVVYDRRTGEEILRLGARVDHISLDAGFRIASLSPAEVGSTAGHLQVVVDDRHGFTLVAPTRGWVAEFGFYTQSLRKVTVIPEQVRSLRSVLAWAGEDHVAWVWLMADISDAHTISYLPK
jgi:hypothetical protein